ncbi:nuclear transport factor 2 family protein [Puniceibacterium sp. IMCC21224]|uniref:nuclear transport factor 2 family protein n=1 Tax=Puniceibacterium sp. IMCC21224 TaxID=1618204 RepID=UPI00065D7C7F|nr:nuclear transport factor 2 family protein [Puniceibacterium sp. IMCC21224]KMK64864.1 SnoaL-like domain [Puniceibacterium sp. IMCC21224]
MIDSGDPTNIVQRFLAALEARDIDSARGLIAPGFTMIFPGTAPMTSLDALIAWATLRYRFVRKTFAGFDPVPGQGDTATVYCRGTLSGEWPDGSAFIGIRFIDRFELVAGQITRQDVWNDIAETKAAP